MLFVVRVWWKWIVCIHRSRHFSWKGNLGWNNLLRKKCLRLFHQNTLYLYKYFVSLQWTSLLLCSKYSWPCLVEIIPKFQVWLCWPFLHIFEWGFSHKCFGTIFGAYFGEILVPICFWWIFLVEIFVDILGSILARRVFGGGGCHQWEDGEAGRQHATLYEDDHHLRHLHLQQHVTLWGDHWHHHRNPTLWSDFRVSWRIWPRGNPLGETKSGELGWWWWGNPG